MFLVATVRAYFELRQKENELSSLSLSARRSYEELFGQFKLFLFVTVLVALCSVATVVLPTELMLHQWQQGKADYAIYSKYIIICYIYNNNSDVDIKCIRMNDKILLLGNVFCNLVHGITGALLTGNYGMWNAYTLLIMILYAPSKPSGMCVQWYECNIIMYSQLHIAL